MMNLYKTLLNTLYISWSICMLLLLEIIRFYNYNVINIWQIKICFLIYCFLSFTSYYLLGLLLLSKCKFLIVMINFLQIMVVPLNLKCKSIVIHSHTPFGKDSYAADKGMKQLASLSWLNTLMPKPGRNLLTSFSSLSSKNRINSSMPKHPPCCLNPYKISFSSGLAAKCWSKICIAWGTMFWMVNVSDAKIPEVTHGLFSMYLFQMSFNEKFEHCVNLQFVTMTFWCTLSNAFVY